MDIQQSICFDINIAHYRSAKYSLQKTGICDSHNGDINQLPVNRNNLQCV